MRDKATKAVVGNYMCWQLTAKKCITVSCQNAHGALHQKQHRLASSVMLMIHKQTHTHVPGTAAVRKRSSTTQSMIHVPCLLRCYPHSHCPQLLKHHKSRVTDNVQRMWQAKSFAVASQGCHCISPTAPSFCAHVETWYIAHPLCLL